MLGPETFTPFAKNLAIGKYFRQIDMANKLDSGMRRLMRYGKIIGGIDPEMVEGDVFRFIVKVQEFQRSGGSTPGNAQATPEIKQMLSIMRGEMTRRKIQEKPDLKDKKHFREHYQQVGIKLSLKEMTTPGAANKNTGSHTRDTSCRPPHHNTWNKP